MYMNDRKSEYLDKIVDFMIDDTEYNIYTNTFSDHSETKVSISFPSTPDEVYDYSKYDIYEWSNGDVWDLDSGDDMDYVCDTYSICDIDTVQELYNRYIQKLSIMIYPDIIKVEKHNNSINESVDRKKEFLDKVANFIVDDSVIEYEDKSVKPPFTTLWFDASYICNRLPHSLLYTFFRYCEDAYNLNSVESNYVWGVYSSIICNKFNNSINESVDRKQDYLDKIVGYLVDDTKIEVVSKRWNPPFMTIWLERSSLFSHDVPHAGIFHRFYEYCKETYGLTDGEMMGVWNKYTKSLIYKLRDF